MNKLILSWAMAWSLLSLNCFGQKHDKAIADIDAQLAETQNKVDDEYLHQLGQANYWKTDAFFGGISGLTLALVLTYLLRAGVESAKKPCTTEEITTKGADASSPSPSRVLNLMPKLIKMLGIGFGSVTFLRELYIATQQVLLSWQHDADLEDARDEAEVAKAKAEKRRDVEKALKEIVETFKATNPGLTVEQVLAAAVKTEL